MYFLVARPGVSGTFRPLITPPKIKFCPSVSCNKLEEHLRVSEILQGTDSPLVLQGRTFCYLADPEPTSEEDLSLEFVKCLSRRASVSTSIISSLVNYGTCDSTPVICAELSLRYRGCVELLGIQTDPGF